MIGWRTSISLQLFTKHFWIAVFVVFKHRLHLVFRTRLECGSLSAYTHQHCVSNTFELWFCVVVQAFSSFFVKHVLMSVSCCVQAFVSTRVSNTVGLRFLVCVHASVPDTYLCTHIRFQLCSNTFDFGCLFVYPPARTCKRDSLVRFCLRACGPQRRKSTKRIWISQTETSSLLAPNVSVQREASGIDDFFPLPHESNANIRKKLYADVVLSSGNEITLPSVLGLFTINLNNSLGSSFFGTYTLFAA